MAELAMRRSSERAAEHVRHQLHAVTDAERRHAELEDRGVDVRRAVYIDAARPARQDDADRPSRPQRADGGVERQDFAIDRELAEASRDQLGELRSEIENENGLMRQCMPWMLRVSGYYSV